jgi:uncharacterized membrane protein
MTRRLTRCTLLTLAGVLTILAGHRVVTDAADAQPSTPAAVLTSVVTHGPLAVADRPSHPTAPIGVEILVLTGVGLAVAVLAGWTTLELTDHRSWAIVSSLRCRRRGPPARFTV